MDRVLNHGECDDSPAEHGEKKPARDPLVALMQAAHMAGQA